MKRAWHEFWNGPSASEDRIVLAPMEGVVDSMMRDRLTRIGGLDLCVTEFLRVQDRLLPDSEFEKDAPELFTGATTPAGIPVLVQFLGGQPQPIAENAVRAVELGAKGIDLNFGCPAKTVNRHDGGATLLKNPHRVFDVLSAVRKAVRADVPVSAKVRLGFSDKEFHVDIARAADEAEASWLTVHARTRDEGYRPPAHWEYIARMRESVSMTVIANGEIWTREDYAKAREISGCRHVMIGRGLLADPGLAREIKGLAPAAPWEEALAWFEHYVRESLEWKGEDFAAARAKQWMRNLSRRYDLAKTTFEETKRLERPLDIIETARRLCNTPS